MWEKTSHSATVTPPRRSFALTGRSIPIDPVHNAVRPDLADIRLAEHVFAPHYAAPMPSTVTHATALHLTADASSEVLAQLGEGEVFEVLEVLRHVTWGVSPTRRLAGYVARSALERIA